PRRHTMGPRTGTPGVTGAGAFSGSTMGAAGFGASGTGAHASDTAGVHTGAGGGAGWRAGSGSSRIGNSYAKWEAIPRRMPRQDASPVPSSLYVIGFDHT